MAYWWTGFARGVVNAYESCHSVSDQVSFLNSEAEKMSVVTQYDRGVNPNYGPYMMAQRGSPLHEWLMKHSAAGDYRPITPRPARWTCPYCGGSRPSSKDRCDGCGASRRDE
jgi:hypothetical protein